MGERTRKDTNPSNNAFLDCLNRTLRRKGAVKSAGVLRNLHSNKVSHSTSHINPQGPDSPEVGLRSGPFTRHDRVPCRCVITALFLSL